MCLQDLGRFLHQTHRTTSHRRHTRLGSIAKCIGYSRKKMTISVCIIGLLLLREATAISTQRVDIETNITVHMNHVVSVPFIIHDYNDSLSSKTTTVTCEDDNIAMPSLHLLVQNGTSSHGIVNITGVFLGRTKLIFILNDNSRVSVSRINVVREERTIDTVFTASVAILVSVLCINFGCAMDWSVCRNTLKRPVGPAIGFFCQFLIMPLLSYIIGYLIFSDHPDLQIGMFFTGISPSGGASNIWTVLLDGNLNLSITMTTICTIAAFGMMPFWIFTLGRHIFARGDLVVPYRQIGTFLIGLVIPLIIGFFIQKKFPKLSRILVRIMKPFSVILIVFIIIFAIVTNLYLFKLFSWEIILAGLGLPWLGFLFGFTVAKICKQSQADVRAIAIETGVQNTGVAIFLLRFTLEPPSDDLTTVIPVSTAIMTPIPLMILYIIKLVYQRSQKTKIETRLDHASSSEKLNGTSDTSDISTITQTNGSTLINNTQ